MKHGPNPPGDAIDRYKKALSAAVISSFAEMAFIDVAECRETEFEFRQIESIDIAEPFRGKILVKLSFDVKRNIAEYVHGTDWENLRPGKIDDCLLELLNVMGGTFLFNLYGESEKYKILFPEMIFDETELPDLKPQLRLYFNAEEEYFSVELFME